MANQFLQFAYDPSAYVRTNLEWNAAAVLRSLGYPPGILAKEDLNKAMRQGTAMAAALGGFISDQGYDALDDGNVVTLELAFVNAQTALITSVTTPLINAIVAAAVPSFFYQNLGIT